MMMTRAHPVIAIDGPAASGKGTLGRRVAAHFGFCYLDTGLLYRAVGVLVLRASGDPRDAEAAAKAARTLSGKLGEGILDDPDLRGDDAAQAASRVAAIPAVRGVLLDFQRDFAMRPPGGEHGAVLDGRDIGTVVCPDADLKLFVTASVETRANRRLLELQERGETVTYADVLEDLRRRDARDSQRAVAPLVPARDAVMLDTSDLTADDAFARAVSEVRARLGVEPAPT